MGTPARPCGSFVILAKRQTGKSACPTLCRFVVRTATIRSTSSTTIRPATSREVRPIERAAVLLSELRELDARFALMVLPADFGVLQTVRKVSGIERRADLSPMRFAPTCRSLAPHRPLRSLPGSVCSSRRTGRERTARPSWPAPPETAERPRRAHGKSGFTDSAPARLREPRRLALPSAPRCTAA